MAEPVEELSLQLVTLVRGLRSLHGCLVEAGVHQVEASAAGLLAGLATLGPARLSTLASTMCLDLSTVSRQVPSLERSGWVARTKDPDDHRAQLLELTDEGLAVLEQLRRSRAEVIARLLPDWTDDEVRRFAAQLARFNDDVTNNRAAVLPALATLQEQP